MNTSVIPPGMTKCLECGLFHSSLRCPSATEMFTVQVQGKGVRLKARVPGWVAASVFTFAKENEA